MKFSKIDHDNYLDICWDLLSICNLKCPYCYAKKDYLKTFIINKEQIDVVISTLKSTNKKICVGLLGGEPTLHPLLNYIIKSLNNIKNVFKIKLVTNGTKILKNLFICDKLEINFSFHPSQKNFNIISNIKLLENKCKCVVHLLMQKNKYDVIKDFYNKIKNYKCIIRHEYIIVNDKVIFTSPLFKEVDDYSDGIKKFSFRESYNFSFKNWNCLLSHYRIFADGTVIRECINEKLGNVFRNKINFDNEYKKCKFDFCHDDFLLEIPKWK